MQTDSIYFGGLGPSRGLAASETLSPQSSMDQVSREGVWALRHHAHQPLALSNTQFSPYFCNLPYR